VERRLPGGLSLAQRYDPLGRLIEQRLARRGAGGYDTSGWGQPNGNALVQRGYSRDASGLVQAIDDRNSGKTSYAYDPGERLLQVLRERGPSERFEYDATGNITRAVTERQGEVEDAAFEYGLGNRLLRKGASRYEYDAQGRLICKIEDSDTPAPKTWRYKWDAMDQLLSVARPDGDVWRYGYDALGRRVRKTGPGDEVCFVWKGNVPVHELSGEGEKWTSWIFAQASFVPLAQVRNGDVYSVVTDHLGTPQEMVDGFGRIAWGIRSKAYGEKVLETTDGISCPFRFPGQYYDAESGLHYNRCRYYDPETARFIQSDPLRLASFANFYLYASNPVGWIDPWGLAACHDSGERGRIAAEKDLKKAGHTVIAEEVTMVVNGQRIRADFVTKDPQKNIHVFEAKNGTGDLTDHQAKTGVYNMKSPANSSASGGGTINTSNGTTGQFEVSTSNSAKTTQVGLPAKGGSQSAIFNVLKYDV
jgi:RHS repeat-associated protein